jgi:hypothetical protein
MAIVRKTKKVSRKNRNKKTRKYRNIQRGSGPWKNLFKKTPKPEKVSIASVIAAANLAPKGRVKYTNSTGQAFFVPFNQKRPLPAEPFRTPPVNTHGKNIRITSPINKNKLQTLSNAFDKGVLTLTERQQNAAKRAILEVEELRKRFPNRQDAFAHMAAHAKVVIPENPYGTVTYIEQNTSGATSA